MTHYDPAKLPLPETWNDRPAPLQASFSARMGAVFGEPGGREYLRCYDDQVTMTDWCFGRILEALDELGLADHALVIFTSDHGNMLGQHGMTEKGVGAFCDDLMCVPLILRLPGKIPAGNRCAAFDSSVDLAPTILDYLGVRALSQTHGRSLHPSIEGSGDASGAVSGESGDLAKPGVSRMIRTPAWKLTLSLRGPQSPCTTSSAIPAKSGTWWPIRR
jgi:arylsulfatase